jgi:hypothetical protein
MEMRRGAKGRRGEGREKERKGIESSCVGWELEERGEEGKGEEGKGEKGKGEKGCGPDVCGEYIA